MKIVVGFGGGLVMPIILEFTYNDGTRDVVRIPAEIWRMGDTEISKVFTTEKELVSVTLDPFLETADVDTTNNLWPRKDEGNKFEQFKEKVYVGLLTSVQIFNILDFVIILPMGPILMRYFNISPIQFATLASSYSLSSAVVSLLYSSFADKFERKNFLNLILKSGNY